MKILRCNIINYGCLHDFSYEFNMGLNLINRPNGWGKTTFVSFLSSMLYGLGASNKRNIQDNERKHYQPWQGGSFGGSLDFEINGRQYRVERFFGRREKEDIFHLYDLKTMQPSQDFSCNLGLELFGIDKAGYLKSTCISQSNAILEYNNDTLTSRLVKHTQADGDIRQYELALSSIDKVLRFYVKTGNRGEISKLQQEADSFNYQLKESQIAGYDLEKLLPDLTNLEQKKLTLNTQIEHIHQEMDAITHQETLSHYNILNTQLNQKNQELEQLEDFFHDQLPEESDISFYLNSCSLLSEKQLQLQKNMLTGHQKEEYLFLQNLFNLCPSTEKAFCSPTEDSFDSAQNHSVFTPSQQELLVNSGFYQTETSLLFFSEEDEMETKDSVFENLPDEENVCLARNLYFQYHDLLDVQNKREQTLSDMAWQLKQLQTSLDDENNAISACHEKITLLKRGNLSIWILPPLLISVFLSLVISHLISPLTGSFLGLFFILFTFYAFYRRKKSVLKKQIIQIETEIQLRNTSSSQLMERIAQLQKQIELCQKDFSDSCCNISSCLHQLLDVSRQLHLLSDDTSMLTDDYLNQLSKLEARLESYELIQQRRYRQYQNQTAFYHQLKLKLEHYAVYSQRQQKLEGIILNLKSELINYLGTYYSVSESDSPSFWESQLHNLRSQLHTYKKLLSEMHSLSENLTLFLQKHPDFQNINMQTPESSDSQENSEDIKFSLNEEIQTGFHKSLSHLQVEESHLMEQYTECIQQISLCQTQIQQKQDIFEKSVFLKETFSRLNARINNSQEHYRILSLTKQYLQKARQNFTNGYLRSIENNFSHYSDLLQLEILSHVHINSDFQIIISDKGVLRETDWYSRGIHDLIDFCARLSIIEDLFSDEYPFLILDDPFINLDDCYFQRVSTLIHRISDTYQILYFTCSSSRDL